MLEKDDLRNVQAKDIMSSNPKTIAPDEMAVNALDIMLQKEISHLVVTQNEKYLGIIHLHDLVKEGLI
jgi:arabinose-5-phosphate isomerase